MFAGLQARLIAAAVLAGVLALAYWHYTSLIDQIGTLKADKAVLEKAVEDQKSAIDQTMLVLEKWKKSQDALKSTLEDMNVASRQAREVAKEIDAIFAKHSLESLAREKPALIEKRINTGTAKALSALECASRIEPPCLQN